MKILIGYDGSEYSEIILNDVMKAGLPDDAEVIVLSVGEAWGIPLDFETVSTGSRRFIPPNTALIQEHIAEVTEKAPPHDFSSPLTVRRMPNRSCKRLPGGIGRATRTSLDLG